MSEHIIIYSHGFGVEKDDRGLFTDIAASLPNAMHSMFDYNDIDHENNTMTAAPLDVQAKKLNDVINDARLKYPDATIDIIAHSQGCLTVSLAKPTGIRKVIFTTPPDEADMEKKMRQWGSEFSTAETSYLARRDGSTTIVPPEYWVSIKSLDAQKLYNDLATTAELTIITATEDEVLNEVVFDKLSKDIQIIEMATGHNFEGESRDKLIESIDRILGTQE
jgi:hypothetical protein